MTYSDILQRVAALRAAQQADGARQNFPCATCGRFAFSSPDAVCHWCRAGRAPEPEQGTREDDSETAPDADRADAGRPSPTPRGEYEVVLEVSP